MENKIIRKIYQSKVIDVDEEKGIVVNYDNAFNKVDSDKDITRPGCFTKTLKENVNRMKWFLNHNENWLLGVPFIEGTKEDDYGLLSYNRINLDKELGRDVLSDYKLFKDYGRTLEHSIGYIPINERPYDLGNDTMGSELLEVKLWEKSTLTAWGANEYTPLVSIKSMKNVSEIIDFLDRMFKGEYKYSDNRKKKAESLIKELQSLVNEEPGNTTPDNESIEVDMLQTILKQLKTIQ